MIGLPEIFWTILFGLFGLATTVQLVAWWGIFGHWVLHNRDRKQPPNPSIPQSPIPPIPNPQPVSIIICARNEAENLRRYLPVILVQEFSAPWELLVVDDASTDETPVILHLFQEKHPNRLRVLRLAHKTSAGKKHALTQGIAAAKYDWLLLTDADCAPASPYWLAQMMAKLGAKPETEIVLGYGPMISPEEIQRPRLLVSGFFRYETAFVAAQYFSFAFAGMPYMGVGRNLAFKRQVFDRVGGFTAHAHIASGDDDLLVNAAANANNTVDCLEPVSFVYSEAPLSLMDWLRQKQRHLSAGPAYHWRHKIVLGMLGLSQVGHYFLFALLVLAGFVPKIVVGIFVLRLCSIQFVFGSALRVLREPGLFWKIPLYDLLLALYYGLLAPWLLFSKKTISWERGGRNGTV